MFHLPSLMKRSEQKPLAEASWPTLRQHKIVYRGRGLPPSQPGQPAGWRRPATPPVTPQPRRERSKRVSPGSPLPLPLCLPPPALPRARSHGKRRRWQQPCVTLRPTVTLTLAAIISGKAGQSPAWQGCDRYRCGSELPLPWTCLRGGAGGAAGGGRGVGVVGREALIQFGFFSYFPTLSPELSLLCQLSEMLCLTGSLSQISYHLKPLGRERWRPRKGSKWVYQCFFTPRELLDTKGKGIKDLKRAQKRESSL